MRAEVKVAMIVGAVAICGGAIYWFSGDSAELTQLDINKSTMDATAQDTSLASDAKPARSQRAERPAVHRNDEALTTPSRRQTSPAPGQRDTSRPMFQRPTVTGNPTTHERERGSPTPTGIDSPPTAPPDTREPLPPATKEKTSLTNPATITPGASQEPVTQSPPAVVELPRREETAQPTTTMTPRPQHELSRGASQKTHTIVLGDYLITIAQAEYGDGQLWQAIKAANPGLDENHLKVGQQIKIPALAEARRLLQQSARPATETNTPSLPTRETVHPTAGRSTYTIERGDSLTKIARNILGDGSRWREIYELNRDRLDSPDILEIGLTLRMPPLKQG